MLKLNIILCLLGGAATMNISPISAIGTQNFQTLDTQIPEKIAKLLESANYAEAQLEARKHSQQLMCKVLIVLLEERIRLEALHSGILIEDLFKDLKGYARNEIENALIHLEGLQMIDIISERIFLLGPSHVEANKTFLEFNKNFELGALSTEQVNEVTRDLSSLAHQNPVEALRLLHQVDQQVIVGLNKFITYCNSHPIDADIFNRLSSGGCIFFIGSGSSGRIAIDLAAKWSAYCQGFEKLQHLVKNVRGVIAGGDRAFIRAKEGFEDSIADGEKAIKNLKLTENDAIFLLSASGSASFNVGCAQEAFKTGCKIYYFYNSEAVPNRTTDLFKHYGVEPIQIVIAPPSIAGSTRLQAASIAEMVLGSLLSFVALQLKDQSSTLTIAEYIYHLISSVHQGNSQIEKRFEDIVRLAKLEYEIFSDKKANFREIKDKSTQGYVTFLSGGNSFREIMVDTTETPPTFSTNPLRSENQNDEKRKREEFRSYLVSCSNNLVAWETLLGRQVNFADMNDAQQFIVAQDAKGKGGYFRRPTDSGNLIIGVLKDEDKFSKEWNALKANLNVGCQNRAKTAVIMVSDTQENDLEDWIKEMRTYNQVVSLSNIPTDPFGLVKTLVLKQVLNHLSNLSMVLMNKVYGNLMIDVTPSNNKLIDRAIRIIQEIDNEQGNRGKLHYKALYRYVKHAIDMKKYSAEQHEEYTPSVVKIVLIMVKKGCSFEQANQILYEAEENLNNILA
ncbi:MAG: hypothetical protein K0S74_479 [Chlamydiales bacterium]|jgi:N-acetylmuramic acid 6-phosphate etherase|nr:hypothetical protein [Chlamydiales bacterium]